MDVLAACGSARRARGVYRLYGCVIGLAFSTGALAWLRDRGLPAGRACGSNR